MFGASGQVSQIDMFERMYCSHWSVGTKNNTCFQTSPMSATLWTSLSVMGNRAYLPIELTLGGPPMLEGAELCFTEPAWPSLVVAAAAGTCGEVGGELGDLLSDALGLADRFSGCAPSLSCKNQNSTVSPAVTTVGNLEAGHRVGWWPLPALAIEFLTCTN